MGRRARHGRDGAENLRSKLRTLQPLATRDSQPFTATAQGQTEHATPGIRCMQLPVRLRSGSKVEGYGILLGLKRKQLVDRW